MRSVRLWCALDKHINNEELHALVPTHSEIGCDERVISAARLREAEAHVLACGECNTKVRKYRLLVSAIPPSRLALPERDCPEGVDWYEVAAGLWPELKARQLMEHAALCEHCGPQLRAAARLDHDPTPQEEKLLAQLKAPSRPDGPPAWAGHSPFGRFVRILVPVMALVVIAVVVRRQPSSLSEPLPGSQFAELAVGAHRMHEQGGLALDIHSDSQERVNEWLKEKSQLPLALPISLASTGETNPYRLDGARLLQVRGRSGVLIAYQPQTIDLHTADLRTDEVSLIVVPDSTAIASAGVEANFKKITFHYANVDRYRVVTWSQHGLTYALVSQEGNSTQRSCMVCHSAMKDRDLSRTPTPLNTSRAPIELLTQ